MRIFIKKAFILIACVPLYPFVMWAEWYEKSKYFGPKFSIRKASREYWAEVWEALTYRKEAR